MESVLTKNQKKVFGPRPITGWGDRALIKAEVRYDDECNNGHNSFSITGEIYIPGRRDCESCGCIHDEIAKAFPELAPLIKWHLFDSTGPMHYIANTIYLAGNKDYNGRAKGEVSNYEFGLRFNEVPITHRVRESLFKFIKSRLGSGEFQIIAFAHNRDPKTYSLNYTFTGYGSKWHECPFRDKTKAEEFCKAVNTCKVEFVQVPTDWSNGKERELNAARHTAIWPDATDEDLTAPGLEERLKARLPKLLEEFRVAVESLGFTF